ncbi:hypothetical protein B0H14DRAFT_2933903, partial [Mycena olivaceomarginata]
TSPPSPAAFESSSMSASTGPLQTPVLSDHLPLGVLPAQAVPNAITPTANASAGGVKRTAKPNRRTTTAQRRATHNAVERQRRETLNGRFYDLAALLPNLSQIRRPSKSAIVNSSIAHITASRRQRLLAAQQLRLIKAEGDALRAECFAVGLAGELKFEVGDLEGEMYGEEEEEHEGGGGAAYPGHGGGYEEEQFVNHSALSSSPHSLSLHALPHPSQSHYPASIPMIASPTSALFDPAPIAHTHTHAVYDQHARQLHPHQMMLAHRQQQRLHHGKWAAASQQQVQVQVQQGTW